MKTKLLWLAPALVTACAHVPPADNSAAISLAGAEAAFAAQGTALTVNDAFHRAFADEGVIFRPLPVNVHKALNERPMNPTLLLRWTPTYAETSADGDLGFTTGPSEYGTRGQKPAGTGYFLSVWQRVNGTWKVAADGGIDSPIPVPVDSAPRLLVTRGNARTSKLAGTLEAAEAELVRAYSANFARMAAADARVYRDGHMPTTTREAAAALVRNDPAAVFQSQYTAVSASGELGYVYGVINPSSDKPRSFMRIYRRNSSGAWTVAADWRN